VTPASGGCCCGGADSDESASANGVRSEADLLRFVEAGRGNGGYTAAFLELLDERHAVYAGVGTPAVVRMRGALLLALGDRVLPTAALPFVLEELESPHDAWLTAVAARVLRHHPEPSASFVEPLLTAVASIRHRDDAVRLDTYGGYGGNGEPTTATAETLRTLAWLGKVAEPALPRLVEWRAQQPGPIFAGLLDETIAAIRAGAARSTVATTCCDRRSAVVPLRAEPSREVRELLLQDQSGETSTFDELFVGRPSIVVFFYTRCDNPGKCPATIARLGRLQERLRTAALDGEIRTAAITYDPAYDVPHRLRQYASTWGVSTGEGHRMLRTVGDFAPLQAFFDLGVGYGSSRLVNRHQLQAFVLDPTGAIAGTVARTAWDEADLLAAADRERGAQPMTSGTTSQHHAATITAASRSSSTPVRAMRGSET
jgi:protein SCO1